jgi:hypothetical protein
VKTKNKKEMQRHKKKGELERGRGRERKKIYKLNVKEIKIKNSYKFCIWLMKRLFNYH